MTLPIHDQAWDAFTHATPRYHDPNNTPEGPVNLATIEQDIRTGIEDVVAHAEDLVTKAKLVVEEHLPGLAAEAAKAEASPIVQALEGAFLPPADEAMIASLITKLAAYAAEHAPSAAEAPAAAPAGLDVPGDPGDLQAVPAGPVVGGQA